MRGFPDLKADFRRTRMQFIHTELETGGTFADVARTEREAGNEDRSNRNIELADRALSEAVKRLGECDPRHDTEAFDAAQAKARALRERIGQLRGDR